MPQILSVLGAARKLVTHFSHSVFATNALIAKQGNTKSKLKLIQDVPTRWNSSYLMMEHLLKLHIPVYAVIFDDEVTKPSDRLKLDLKDNFWKIMEEIVPILEPLAEMTEILGKEDQPTGGAVYLLLHNIFQNVLDEVLDDSNVTGDLKLKIKEGLQKRFKIDLEGVPNDEVMSSPLVMASVLDPRYKTLLGREILPTCKLEVVHLILRDLMATLEVNVKTKPDVGQGENIPHKQRF